MTKAIVFVGVAWILIQAPVAELVQTAVYQNCVHYPSKTPLQKVRDFGVAWIGSVIGRDLGSYGATFCGLGNG